MLRFACSCVPDVYDVAWDVIHGDVHRRIKRSLLTRKRTRAKVGREVHPQGTCASPVHAH